MRAALRYLRESITSFDKFRFYIKESAPGRKIQLGSHEVVVFRPGEYSIFEGEGTKDGLKEIWATGSILDGNSSGRFFRDFLAGCSQEDGLGVLYNVSNIGDDGLGCRYFSGPKKATATKGKYYQGVPVGKLDSEGQVQFSLIENYYDLAGAFGNCRHEGGVEFRSGKKPEALLQIILSHFSRPGDLILDSFGGSGTTGAVAHKMHRRWIMIELRDHCDTHIVPRLTPSPTTGFASTHHIRCVLGLGLLWVSLGDLTSACKQNDPSSKKPQDPPRLKSLAGTWRA
jgi:adenine-specific DNA-methyltransferase